MFKNIVVALMTLTFLHACAAKNTGTVNVTGDGVILKGYDAVAYFNEGKPVRGDAKYSVSHQGATYHFTSSKNKKAFEANPSAYAPQYGGYCAFGVAQNKKIDIDPKAWKIVDGKLYLNYTLPTQTIWEKDIPGNIKEANVNWKTLRLE